MDSVKKELTCRQRIASRTKKNEMTDRRAKLQSLCFKAERDGVKKTRAELARDLNITSSQVVAAFRGGKKNLSDLRKASKSLMIKKVKKLKLAHPDWTVNKLALHAGTYALIAQEAIDSLKTNAPGKVLNKVTASEEGGLQAKQEENDVQIIAVVKKGTKSGMEKAVFEKKSGDPKNDLRKNKEAEGIAVDEEANKSKEVVKKEEEGKECAGASKEVVNEKKAAEDETVVNNSCIKQEEDQKKAVKKEEGVTAYAGVFKEAVSKKEKAKNDSVGNKANKNPSGTVKKEDVKNFD